MKARVKAMGEIVEISESYTIYDAGMCHIYNASELENVPDTNPDYWTRLEHQAAIAAMQGLMSNVGQITPKKGRSFCDEIVDISANVAHALVEKMKEGK